MQEAQRCTSNLARLSTHFLKERWFITVANYCKVTLQPPKQLKTQMNARFTQCHCSAICWMLTPQDLFICPAHPCLGGLFTHAYTWLYLVEGRNIWWHLVAGLHFRKHWVHDSLCLAGVQRNGYDSHQHRSYASPTFLDALFITGERKSASTQGIRTIPLKGTLSYAESCNRLRGPKTNLFNLNCQEKEIRFEPMHAGA